jgi:hypothetical protein
MLTKPDRIGQIVAVGDKLSETRDSGEVRQPEIWTRKFLRRTMNMALGAPTGYFFAIRCWLDAFVVPDSKGAVQSSLTDVSSVRDGSERVHGK